MRRLITNPNQTGDTIVEVLIAITVISMVLVGAYIATNNNTLANQTTQERAQAVQLVQSQIEQLRAAGSINDGWCFSGGKAQQATGLQNGTDPCLQTSSGAVAPKGVQPAYAIVIHHTNPAKAYQISATWYDVGGHGQDSVVMYYTPVAVP